VLKAKGEHMMGINCLFFINPCTLPLILILLNSNLSIRKEINLSTYFNLMVEEKFLSLFSDLPF
jgi:hypothetical protein